MLPSNDSLHEDLILEELEVFQVGSSSSLLLLTQHFVLCNIKERVGVGGGDSGRPRELC